MGHSKSPPLKTEVCRVTETSRVTVDAAHARTIGIDVHSALLCCSAQIFDPETTLLTTYYAEFGTVASELKKFAQWCLSHQPEVILMESTGILWRSPYEALEDIGFTSNELAVVNARDVKAAMGRKTDKTDAERLATFARLGSFRKSFIPSRNMRDQRSIARRYQQERMECARTKNRYHKTLSTIGFRASSVFSKINGVAATEILDARLFGSEQAFRTAVEANTTKNHRLRKATPEQIIDALNFEGSEALKSLAREERQKLYECEARAMRYLNALASLQTEYEGHIMILCSIPGIDVTAARLIFAELAPNLNDFFPDSAHFASWLGICPGNNVSAGKSHSGRTPKGNKWLRRVLTECAQAIAKMKHGSLRVRFAALVMRKRWGVSIVALAHKLARIIFACLTNGVFYNDETDPAKVRETCDRYVRGVKKRHAKFVAISQEVTGTAAGSSESDQDTCVA